MIENVSHSTISFFVLFWIFLIGSVAGIFIEGIWEIIKGGNWENHSATIWGPFCIIYGIGAAALYIASYSLEDKNIFIGIKRKNSIISN